MRLGGGVEGRLEFFRKFIRFGSVTLPLHQSNVRKEVKSDRVAWTSSHPEYSPNDFTAPSVLAAVYQLYSFQM